MKLHKLGWFGALLVACCANDVLDDLLDKAKFKLDDTRLAVHQCCAQFRDA